MVGSPTPRGAEGNRTYAHRFLDDTLVRVSKSFAEMVRQRGMKKADSSRIIGYKSEEQRRALQYR